MKKRLLFLLPVLLLACKALSPTPTEIPFVDSLPTRPVVATPVLEATAFVPTLGFTLVRIYPKDGDLQGQLAVQAQKAKVLGQVPFLEFDATWCPPCQAITASLAARDALLMSAYHGVYLIHVDVDEWGGDIPAAGFNANSIPAFYALDSAGKATGAMVTGAAWKEDIPENIAPVLTKFFHP